MNEDILSYQDTFWVLLRCAFFVIIYFDKATHKNTPSLKNKLLVEQNLPLDSTTPF